MSDHPSPPSDPIEDRLADARRLHEQGRLDQAQAAYEDLLSESPRHPELLRLAGVLKYRTGDLPAAADLFRRAVEAGSRDGRAMEALGFVLAETGKEEEAIHCLAQVAAAHPQQQSAFLNLGLLLMNQAGRLDEAIEALERAVSLEPEDTRALGALARAQLCRGQAWDALVRLDKVLSGSPGDVYALAHKLAALSQLGHASAIGSLADLDSMVYVDAFGGGSGFERPDDLNARLADHVLSGAVPDGTGSGLSTGEMLDSDAPEIRSLVEFLVSSVRRMVGQLDLEAAHPFMASRPETWFLSGQGLRITGSTTPVPRIHRHAWISGVYCVRLPPTDEHGTSGPGQVEIGRGPEDIFRESSPAMRRVRPEEGTLLAFPSYFWHRIVPSDDDQEGLYVWFHVVPDDD